MKKTDLTTFVIMTIICFKCFSQDILPDYMVSVNDFRWILADGMNKTVDNPEQGSITILDFSTFPPKATNVLDVPCSVIGPPTCVAITADNKIAIVAAAMKLDPEDSAKQIADNRLTVVSLKDKKVINTLRVGGQPSGISVSPDGKNALVCNRADGTIITLKINGIEVVVNSTLKVCEPQDSLSHITFSPNGDYALASVNKKASLLKIGLKNGVAEKVLSEISVGKGPYCVEFTPDGKFAVVANTADATISVVKVTKDDLTVVDTIFVGVTPEGLDISADGKWIAVSCLQYSMVKPDDSKRQQYGQVVLLKRQLEYLSIVQRMQTDRIPQAVVFTADSKYLVVAGFENRRLRIYELKGEKLVDTDVVIELPGQPCTLRIAD